jgi:hypothetical protein
MSKLKRAVRLRVCAGAFVAAVAAIMVVPGVAEAALPTFCPAGTTFTFIPTVSTEAQFENDVCFVDQSGGTNTITMNPGTYSPSATVAFQQGNTTLSGPSSAADAALGVPGQVLLTGGNVAPFPSDFIDISAGASLDILNVDVSAGGNPGTNPAVSNQGTFTLDHSNLDGNPGPQLVNGSGKTATITDSTIGSGSDFGIENNGGILNITQSTIAFNAGGGISNTGGTLHLTNSIVADNTASTSGGVADCTGTKAASPDKSIDSDGTCGVAAPLSAVNPNLANNFASSLVDGGTTNGFPLNPGSPAIGAGDPAKCLSNDQRSIGFGTCDIGSTANRQGPQSVSFLAGAPGTEPVGGVYTPSAQATTGLTVQFFVDGSSTPGACHAGSGNASIVFDNVPGGTCVIDAVQTGNFYASPSYLTGVPTQTVHVAGKQSQTVTFTSTAPTNPAPGTTYTPTATASSGLTPVQYAIDGSSTPGACTVTNGGLTILFHNVAGGRCTIDAYQAGNASFNPSWLTSVPTQTMTVA